MTGIIQQMTRLQRRLHKAGRMLDEQDTAADYTEQTTMGSKPNQADAAGMNGQMPRGKVLHDRADQAEEAYLAVAASRRQAQDYAPAIDYDRIAEAASQRPVVVYVDKKAAAVLMTREMDTAIGNRNIQQLVSMGG